MAKTKTTFFCQNCGSQHAKWMGQCSTCNEWNTIVEEVIQKEEKREWKQSTTAKTISKPLKISDIQLNPEERVRTNNNELDTVFRWRISQRICDLIRRRTRYRKINSITSNSFKKLIKKYFMFLEKKVNLR